MSHEGNVWWEESVDVGKVKEHDTKLCVVSCLLPPRTYVLRLLMSVFGVGHVHYLHISRAISPNLASLGISFSVGQFKGVSQAVRCFKVQLSLYMNFTSVVTWASSRRRV